jgi:hypothetical protein
MVEIVEIIRIAAINEAGESKRERGSIQPCASKHLDEAAAGLGIPGLQDCVHQRLRA